MGTQSVESDWNRTRNYKKKRPRGSEEEVYRFEWKVVRSPNGDAQNPAKRIASFRSLRSSLGDANLSFSGRLSTSLAFFRAFCTPMPMRKWQKSLNLEVATPAIVPEMAHSEEFLYESTASTPVTEHTASVGICGQDDNALFRPLSRFPCSTTGE